MLKRLLCFTLTLTSLTALADSAALKSALLAQSDQDLWRSARTGKVGKCFISRAVDSGGAFCDYYVGSDKWAGTEPYKGLPTKGGKTYGSGCLVASSSSMMNAALPADIKESKSKNVTTCWGSPNTYPNFNSSSTPICTADHVKNAANMIRIAINDPADPCDFASIVPPSNQAADSSTELVLSGKIKFDPTNITKCWRVNAGAKVNGVFPAPQLYPETCRKLANRLQAKKGKNAFLPTVSTADYEAIALGKLSSTQIQDIIQGVYIKKNEATLYQIDQLNSVDVSKLDAAAKTEHEKKLEDLSKTLKEATAEEIKQALAPYLT